MWSLNLPLFCILVVSVQSRQIIVLEDSDVSLKQLRQEIQNANGELQLFKKTAFRLEAEIRRLQEVVDQLERKLVAQDRDAKYLTQDKTLGLTLNADTVTKADAGAGKSIVARSCLEILLSQPGAISGMYYIDPDGPGVGETPIYVYCDMIAGMTKIEFDSKENSPVQGCNGPGCFSKTINYFAEMRQIKSLIDISSECHQSFTYSCIESPLHYNNEPYSWWLDRDRNPQYYWTKDDSANPTCDCGVDRSCINPLLMCNCDASSKEKQIDTGLITNKNALPITEVNFGLRASTGALGIYTLGPLECSGRNILKGVPTSCRDLWMIGHTLNGFYSIMAAGSMQTVYCDFNELPESNAMQTVIGLNDVKSAPVYFYVQRSSSFTNNGTLSFELERMNIGGAMDIQSGVFTAPKAGVYFFSFDGMKRIDNSTLKLHLYWNEVLVETTYAPISTVYQHLSLSSSLPLRQGDQVKLVLEAGGLYDNDDHYGGFVGHLLQEDFSTG